MGLANESPRLNALPRNRRRPRQFDAGVVATGWQALAGRLAVIADTGAQGAAACRRCDGPALASLIDRLRVATLDAISFRNTHDNLDQETKS